MINQKNDTLVLEPVVATGRVVGKTTVGKKSAKTKSANGEVKRSKNNMMTTAPVMAYRKNKKKGSVTYSKTLKVGQSSDKQASSNNLPTMSVLVEEQGLSRYLKEIKKYPLLTAEEEKKLAVRWIKKGDRNAAHQLVTSHLRLVAKIAFGYRGYGLPMAEIIAEGNIGLMQAVRKFEPEKGFRLSTYAMWWIKASIHDYIIRSWSLVKMGTTAAQKKLFFNLNRAKVKLQQLIGEPLGESLNQDQIKFIAHSLDVEEKDVEQMEQRMTGGDQSLNAPMGGEDDKKEEWQSLLKDKGDTPDEVAEGDDLIKRRHEIVTGALSKLSTREREIILKRHLNDNLATLEDLSQHYGISRERVRQIESKALEKLKDYLEDDYRSLLS